MTVQMTKRRTAATAAAADNTAVARDADANLRKNMAILLQLDSILPMAGWIHRRYAWLLASEGQGQGQDPEQVQGGGGSDGGERAHVELPEPPGPPGTPEPPAIGRENLLGVPTRAEEQQQQQQNKATTTITTESDPKDEIDDEWGDCGQLLNLEAALTDPGSQHPLHSGVAFDPPPPPHQHLLQQHNLHSYQHNNPPPPQQQQGQAGGAGGSELLQEDATMRSEIFDYHWFMDNIGNMGNPSWWSTVQGK